MQNSEQPGPSEQVRPGHRLLAYSLLNAAGQGIPIAVAIVAVPLLVRELGVERFGLLTLTWTAIGYASLFDFGLGRALTQIVAERRHDDNPGELVAAVWSALIAMTAIGVVAGVLAFAAAPWITTRALTISPALAGEALITFRLVAVGIPIVVVTAGLRGVLEAYERFDLVNAVKAPVGLAAFVGPLVIAVVSRSLQAAVAVLVVARIAGLIAQAIMVRRALPAAPARPRFAVSSLGPVMRFGAWMTVSNILSPLMSSADRFFIGAMLSASVVAYYTAPYEMVTRLLNLVALAVATSIFPAFARWRDNADARDLFKTGVRLILFAFLPIMLGVIVLAPLLLKLWLGAEFAARSTVVLRVLASGVLLNGLAQIPFAHIQAVGRADLTAKIHIAEVPAYLATVLYLIRTHGIEGAAIAWTLRMAVDTTLMFIVSRRLLAVRAAATVITEPA